MYHMKGDVIWALGPKTEHEVMRCQNVFHSRAQFFNMIQDENETLDEYWKRSVDIERKCDINSITAGKIITYIFAATIKDKKARDNFIKGPL